MNNELYIRFPGQAKLGDDFSSVSRKVDFFVSLVTIFKTFKNPSWTSFLA